MGKYSNVKTPRFYVSVLQWLKAMKSLDVIEEETEGLFGEDPTIFGDLDSVAYINPSSTISFFPTDTSSKLTFESKIGNYNQFMPANKNFCMVLGHDFGTHSDLGNTYAVFALTCNNNTLFSSDDYSDEINYATIGEYVSGFSAVMNNNADSGDSDKLKLLLASSSINNASHPARTFTFGSVLYGTYYDMPISPDLNLNISYETNNAKTSKSIKGSTFSNIMNSRPADWGGGGAWQMDKYPQTPVFRNARRSWDLSFSYMSDTDAFPVNANSSYQYNTSDGYYTENNTPNPTSGFVDLNTSLGEFHSNILTGSDFFSVVWNKTLGNALPFVFQPDNTNNNPDQFAICKFVNDSLQYEQVALNVYNIKLKIEEVW